MNGRFITLGALVLLLIIHLVSANTIVSQELDMTDIDQSQNCVDLELEEKNGITGEIDDLCFSLDTVTSIASDVDDITITIDGNEFEHVSSIAITTYDGGDMDVILDDSLTKIQGDFVDANNSVLSAGLLVDFKREEVSIDGIVIKNTLQELSRLQSLVALLDESLTSLTQWLFWTPEKESICAAVSEGCDSVVVPDCQTNLDCGQDGPVGDAFCQDNNVVQETRQYTCGAGSCNSESSTVTVQECGELTCQNGACVDTTPPDDPPEENTTQTKTVIFRTNVDDSNYFFGCTLSTNCWVSLDFNGDGELELFGYDGKTDGCRRNVGLTKLVDTPEGYDVFDYGSSTKVSMCTGQFEVRWSTRRNSVGGNTDTVPVEPYASNGQETYAP